MSRDIKWAIGCGLGAAVCVGMFYADVGGDLPMYIAVVLAATAFSLVAGAVGMMD